MKRLLIFGLFALFGATACVGVVTKDSIQVTPEVLTSLNKYKKEYILSPGDTIEVIVYRHPDFSTTGVIRPDGYISIPVLDDVKAAGMAPKALDDYLTRRLSSERLLDPEVTIIVKSTLEPMVYVFGEVLNPIPIPLRSAKTVAQAISQVGGAKKTAAIDSITVIRLNNEGFLEAIMIEKTASKQPAFIMALHNMPLQADDLIVVPESWRAQFVRGVNDFMITPLSGINQTLMPYFQFRLIKEIEDDE